MAAVGRTVPEIREYYKNRRGNAHGLPVVHVAVNAEDDPFFWYATEDLIGEHGFDPVCNDYVRTNNTTTRDGFVRLQFQPDWQRPVFLAINCVSNSPSHPQWQLLVNHGGYNEADFMNKISQWRAIIDSVKAPPPRIAPPAVVGSNVQFTIPGQRGQTNRVEASSDLLAWTTVTNLIGTSAPVTVRDAITGRRFYRVVRP